MIRPFRDLPIKRKLTTVIMMTCMLVLLLACAAFVGYEYILSKRALVETARTLSAVAGESSTAAFAFKNEDDARLTLKALQADPRILSAALYDQDGHLFVAFGEGAPPPSPPPMGSEFRPGELWHTTPIIAERQQVGTLFVRLATDQIYTALRAYLGITLGILLVSFVVAFLVATALRRRIAAPILELADTTRVVSQQNNYAARANKHSNDELGQLTDSFNRMMARIQESDAELRRSQARLKLALESGRIGTWDWDVQARRMKWDNYMEPLVGSSTSADGISVDDVLMRIHPDDREMVRQAGLEVVAGKSSVSVSFRVVWPDGGVRYFTARGAVPADDPNSKRVTGVLIDITQTKRAEEEVRRLNEELEQRVAKRTEELAQANKELESFTYSVSHDLRAPLRHINGFAQMLEQECAKSPSPEVHRLLSRIRFGARNMGQLVDDLLRLARVGRQELMLQECPLGDIVSQVLRELRSETEGRQIEWKVGSLPTVWCDLGLMRQVFANLISNAVKYTRTRAPAVVTVSSRQENGEHVISIRDNGVGFDMKYAEKLFGVFQRLHRVEEFEGTGVGLAIVQRIIHKHGGRVWAEAQLDQGACFSFSLPIAPPQTA